MAPGDPPRKPWGAPASYGRGAKKPPAVGARARRSSAPVYNPPVPRAGGRGDDDDDGDAAPSRAGTVDDANFRAWQRVASNAKASSRPEKKDASKASTPPSPFGSDIDALAAPDGSYVPLGENTHASFHDLGPEEKRKVAKLIRQVVELSEARSKLEKELDELRARCVSLEEGARKDAQAAEANGRAEIECLRGKLARALATIDALTRPGGDVRASISIAATGQASSGELTITPLPDTPARGVLTEPADGDAAVAMTAPTTAVPTVVSPPETVVVRASGGAPREEATPEPSTPPAVVVAAAAAAAAAKNAAAAAKPPPAGSPFVPGLSPGSARDLRWLSAVQSGASRAPAWAKASMLAAAARNAAALRRNGAPGSDSSSPSPGPATPISAIHSGATTNMTLSPDSSVSVSVAAPSPMGARDDTRDVHHESSSAKDGERRNPRSSPSTAPELPPEVLAAAKRAAVADPDDALVAALAAAAAAQAGIHWEPFGTLDDSGSPRAVFAEQGAVESRPKVLRFDPEMGPSGAFYFADASVDTTSASSMATGSPAVPAGGGDSFDASFAVERVHGASERAETNGGTNGEESEAPRGVIADVAEKVTGRTVAAVLGVDEDGRRVSAEEAARFMLRVDREMTSYAAAAAAPPSAPSAPRLNPGFGFGFEAAGETSAARVQPDRDHEATFAFSDASFSAVMHPPDMSPPSRIIEEFLVLKGTTPAPEGTVSNDPGDVRRRTGLAPSPESAAALEACLGVTEPRADPVGDHVSSAPVTPVRAFDEFVKRRHGDGRASSIVAAAAERVRLGESSKGRGGASGVLSGGARGGRAGATSASSPAPPPSSLGGGLGGSNPNPNPKPAFVMTPNSLATRREKAAQVAERLLALERTEAAAGEVVAAERVEVPSPSPDEQPRTPAPVAWEIPSPDPAPASSVPRLKPSSEGETDTPATGKDTPARLLDDARAFAFDVSLVDLVDEAEAMLREEEDEDEDEDEDTLDLSDDDERKDDAGVTGRRRARPTGHSGRCPGTRGVATDHKPPSPRTGDAKRAVGACAGGRVAPPAGRKGPPPARRAPRGPMRQRDYNKFGGVRTPPSGGERKKPGWFTSYRSFSVGRAGEPGL